MKRLVAFLATMLLASCCPMDDELVEEIEVLRAAVAELEVELQRAEKVLEEYQAAANWTLALQVAAQ